MTLSAGTKLGPYEILAPIGAGGMGEVYRARDSKLGRDVAIKVLPERFAADADSLARFEREARAVAALSHPNILSIFDFGREGNLAYAVMELLDGETLRARLSSGALPARKAVEIAAQIARGLAAAHEKGIVHRDLKPENVFVLEDGRVKILDFGLAKVAAPTSDETKSPTVAASATEPGTVMGTVGYMSPEQVRGLPADHRSDIFSFGSILYEMVTGSRAFRGDSAAETMAAIAQKDPPEISAAGQPLSPALDRIVRHCLEKNPAERFQSARDLAFDLETVTTSAGAPVALGSLSRSRRRLLFAAVGTAGLVLAYLLGSRVGAGRRAPTFSFQQKTYRGQSIFRARFAPDGRTIVYSGAREGSVPELYSLRPEYPEPVSLGLSGVHLLSVSSAGELAVLTGAKYRDHLNFVGTLARVPLGGGAPREVLENVHDADWSPDGSQLAVLREVGGRDRLEFPIGTVVYEYAGYLSDVRVSPRGDRIAFLEHPVRYDNRGSAVILDRTGRRLASSDAYWGEEGLAWARSGDEVLFSAGQGLTEMAVRSLTPSGRMRVVSQIAGTLLIRDVARDGHWLATRDDSRLRIFGRSPGQPERDLSWLESAIAPVLSRDGRMLLLTDQNAAAGANYAACIRKTDGSPVVRLGEGSAQELSPDARSALVVVPSTPPDIRIYPTGAGSAKSLGNGGLAAVTQARWLPDGQSLVVCGNEPGRGTRCYVMASDSGKLRPVTPEGGAGGLPSPDGKLVAARTSEGWALFPVDGGAARPLPGLGPEERAIRWSPDGRSLWVSRLPALPARVESYDVATGRRDPIVEILPDERTGVTGVYGLDLADDPKSYIYMTWQLLSYLFVVDEVQ